MEFMGNKKIFDTDRRIRLGIWGLGRGMAFFETCKFLNFDVVAGCDYNEDLRLNFSKHNPEAFVTADADEFLSQDFDAVLLATFFTAHGNDSIRCLEAGKHVLSECSSFFTLAEGVRLVETVEKKGLVYNLAENYPFSEANMYLARKWQEGLFGELMYAEYEYVHECRSLCYTYLNGIPVLPGNTAHNWRSWLNFHYYCTHSLGPVMVITGLRPTRVVSLPGQQRLPGYLVNDSQGMGGIAPSLINMSNGAIVRNLMGSTTNDSHVRRLWGTRGSSEIGCGKDLSLRLGASGHSPKLEVKPSWDDLGEIAKETGHGGGDFWVLYYFARQILFGTPAPFEVYSAADVTIAGIQAFRSSINNGEPMEIPDFRDPGMRKKYRNDNWSQEPYFAQHTVFPVDSDIDITKHFCSTMSELVKYSTIYRAYVDWASVQADLVDKSSLIKLLNDLIEAFPLLKETYAMARKLLDTYPSSDGARVIREMLVDVGDENIVMEDGFIEKLQQRMSELKA